MEHPDDQFQDAEPRRGWGGASAGGTQPLPANTQNRPLDYRPLGPFGPPDPNENNADFASAADAQLTQSTQASEHDPGAGDTRRLQEAQAAFSANSEVTATTPRRSVWRGDSQLSVPQSIQGLTDEPEDQEWTPRLALGSINADKIGAREAARRHMLQWDRIYAFHEATSPGSLQTVSKNREKARRVYEELLASEQDEDSLPKNDLVSYKNERIQARTALLWKALLEAPEEGCEPMKANITAALKGYNTGIIGFSANYTLIYAGHIVDTTCATYSSFTIDRQERLDRYFEEYGPGYLWWEPPLAKGRERVLAKKSTALNLVREEGNFDAQNQQAPNLQDDACHYKVPLGFKRDDNIRRRLKSRRKRSVVAKETHPEPVIAAKRKWDKTENPNREPHKGKREKLTTRTEALRRQGVTRASAASTPYREEDSATAKSKTIEHDDPDQTDDTPTIFFDMLLDSGAELPILLHDDFEVLGYSKRDMNAATVVELSAAAGQSSTALCFELRVGLELEGSTPPSLVEKKSWTDRLAYSEARFFLCRVIKLPPSVPTPAYGAFSGDRLSGMLPFLAYYMASAPGNGKLCLGEKRAEVLSVHNLPGGLEYDPFNDPNSEIRVKRREEIAKIHRIGGKIQGLRKVTFETDMEDGRKLFDEDVVGEGSEEMSSKIGIVDKYGDLIDSWGQAQG